MKRFAVDSKKTLNPNSDEEATTISISEWLRLLQFGVWLIVVILLLLGKLPPDSVTAAVSLINNCASK